MDHMKHAKGVKLDTDLSAADMKELSDIFKGVIKAETGRDFPQNVYDQLKECAMAVFRSATGHKAKTYAKQMGWKNTLPTAVNVCTMVFGNMGDDSATGVAFTRDPSTGSKTMLGEYLINAQGEDVVAGIRTPKPIAELAKEMPKAYKQFMTVTGMLEKKYQNMQDVEFTIEQGTLVADAQRQAHGKERDQDRGRHGQRKTDQQRRSRRPRHTGRCRFSDAPAV
jgi:pyruvate, orthophosphate dikinase